MGGRLGRSQLMDRWYGKKKVKKAPTEEKAPKCH